MVTLIQAATRLEAWMRGTEYLLAHDSALNLVLAWDGRRSYASF